MSRVAPERLIDPAVLARLGNLELLSRRVVDGFISGLHRTLFQGASTEFGQYREYVPGDDVRHIDWKLYGRTDRLYLKTFEAESNADVMIAIDASASMAYRSNADEDAPSKLDYARYAAACLAHLIMRQRDRVGLVAFRDSLDDFQPPSARRREALLRTLTHLEASDAGDFAAAMDHLARRLGRRGLVIVLSDFYLAPADAIAALDDLRLRGQDVLALHILDPAERDLERLGDEGMVLEDMESGQRLAVVPAEFRRAYGEAVRGHIDALGAGLGARRVEYACVTTDQPLDNVLYTYLSERARRARVRA